MKSYNNLYVLAVLAIVLTVTITAFTTRTNKNDQRTDWTMYYWYDASGSYLGRQNMIDDEVDLTGYDEFAYAPYTLREKGYAPGAVTGNPPVPNDPFNPNKRLYSHP